MIALAVLEVHDLVVRLGGVEALAGVEVRVEEYEVVGLAGPDGAGKNTLLDAVSGLCRVSSGRILHRGEDVSGLRPARRVRRGIARTFAGGRLAGSMTVFENLLAAQHVRVRCSALAGLLGAPAAVAAERVIARRARDLLDFAEAGHLADLRPAELPAASRRTVALAAALATDPDVLCVDEPSEALSAGELERVADLLLRIREQLGVTILLADGHLGLVSAVCDHVYALGAGRPVADGSPADVVGHPEVLSAYAGEGQTYGAA